MKKIISLLISVCIVLSVVPTFVSAAPVYFNQGDFKYRTNSAQTAAIIVGLNDGVRINNLVLPESVTYSGKTYEVYAIDNDAFANNLDIESVVMPDTYTTLLINTFYGCRNIKEVTLSQNLTGTMQGTFQYCSSLKECVIPSGVTTLTNTFKYCTSLEKLTVPASVTSVSAIFDGCNKAMSTINVIAPVGSTAETYFRNLGCTMNDEGNEPEEPEVPDQPVITHPAYFADGDFKYRTNSAGTKAIVTGLNDDVTVTDLVLPESVTYSGKTYEVYAIDNDAFAYNTDIESVVMPDTYTTILINTFFGCENLKEVTLSRNLSGTMSGTFQYCSSLEECVIPAGVTTLAKTFKYCTSIAEVEVPASVTSISEIFDGCNKAMRTISIETPSGSYAETYFKNLGCEVNGEMPELTEFEVGDFWYTIIKDTDTVSVTGFSSTSDKSGAKILPSTVSYGDKEYTVVSVGYAAFANQPNLTSFVMADSVTTVGQNIFYGCTKLNYVHLSDSLTNASASRQLVGTFYGCTSLKSVTIPSGITCLPKTFLNSGIENIVLKAKGTEIPKGGSNEYVPISNPDTVKIYYPADGSVYGGYSTYIKNYFIYDGAIAYKQKTDGTLSAVSILPEASLSGAVTIPSAIGALKVTEIATEAFKNADDITSVTIPDSVTVIGDRTFADCDKLENVVFSKNIQGELKGTFAGCTKLSTVIIPEGITTLDGTFEGCSALENVKIAQSVSTLSNKTFYGCSALTELVLPNTVTQITDGENAAGTVFPSGITLIVQEASEALDYAEENDINYVVKPIVEYTVKSGNAEVTKAYFRIVGEYEIPAEVEIGGTSYAVTSIASKAFAGQDALTIVSLPDGISDISGDAFQGCTNADFAVRVNSGKSAYAKIKNITVNYIVDDVASGFAYKKYASKEGLELYGVANDEQLTGDIVITGFDGMDVVSIGEGALRGQNNITSIEMADTITAIGAYAFAECENLVSAKLSESTEGTLDSTFAGCVKLENVDIPEGVTALKNAYNGCVSLTRVIIPENVTAIYANTFAYCTGLETVLIPSTVETFDRMIGFKNESQTEAEYVETNTSKKWVDNPFKGATNENLAICGERGTVAEEFAYSSGIKFIDVAKGDYHFEYSSVVDKAIEVSVRDIYGKGDVTVICALYGDEKVLLSCICEDAKFGNDNFDTVFNKRISLPKYTDGATVRLFAWNNMTELDPVMDDITVKTQEKIKILVLGNSISNHGPSAASGWFAPDGQGMAATSLDKDFVHVMLAKAQEKNPNVEVKIVTAWSLEANFHDWENLIASEYQEAVNYDADIIIAQFGENVKNNENEGSLGGSFDNENAFTAATFANIVKAFMKDGKDVPVIAVTSMMNNKAVVLEAKDQACEENDWAHVNLCNDSNFAECKNAAYYLTPNQIEIGLENGTFHDGVTIASGVYVHPGNNGMRAMAYGIWRYLEPIVEEMTYNN